VLENLFEKLLKYGMDNLIETELESDQSFMYHTCRHTHMCTPYSQLPTYELLTERRDISG